MTVFEPDTLGMVASIGGTAIPTVVFEFGVSWRYGRRKVMKQPDHGYIDAVHRKPIAYADEPQYTTTKSVADIVIFRAVNLTQDADVTAAYLASRQKKLKARMETRQVKNFASAYDVTAWASFDRFKAKGTEPNHWVRIVTGDNPPAPVEGRPIEAASRNWLVTHAIEHLGEKQPSLSFLLDPAAADDETAVVFTDAEIREHMTGATAKPPRIGGNPDEIIELDQPERIACALGWVCWLASCIQPERPMTSAEFRQRQAEAQGDYKWIV
jgi:hypothetical protein